MLPADLAEMQIVFDDFLIRDGMSVRVMGQDLRVVHQRAETFLGS